MVSRGIHPPYNKITAEKEIEEGEVPDEVIIPLHQHIGAPCKPAVEKDDEVLAGGKIGEVQSFVSAPIHASISGRVKDIRRAMVPVGYEADCVVIEGDGKDRWAKFDERSLDELGPKEIVERIREGGLVGMGGAAFPTHVKLSPPPEKRIDVFIANGAECEPYLTCDHRLMVEHPTPIIRGMEAAMKALGCQRGIVGVEDNKPDCVEAMGRSARSSSCDIEVRGLRTRYPQGAEKMLIYSLLGRKVPIGGLPMDVGVVVQNVGTLKAIYEAVHLGKPLVERTITVTGGVKEPKNLQVRIGTKIGELIERCGGFSEQPGKIIDGGPMMGIAQESLDVPVIKGMSGVLVQPMGELNRVDERPCIRCGSCIESCPMGLMPTTIVKYAKRGMYEDCDRYQIGSCIECGCCSWVCPSNIPLVHWLKYGKGEVLKMRQKIKERRAKNELEGKGG
jgi:electron transport complex protein RnfC